MFTLIQHLCFQIVMIFPNCTYMKTIERFKCFTRVPVKKPHCWYAIQNAAQYKQTLEMQQASMFKCQTALKFLISNLCNVLNVVCFLLGNSPVSEFYMPMFQNTVSVPSS